MRKLLKRECAFTAVFACNDHMALVLMKCLKAEGMQVPEQISLVGFDDILFARYLTPALTTVNFPIEQMSAEAVQLVIQALNKNKRDVNFKLTPTLVPRSSVKELHTL